MFALAFIMTPFNSSHIVNHYIKSRDNYSANDKSRVIANSLCLDVRNYSR